MHIAIIGNGISGITAARTIRKLQPDWSISVISAETDHFFSRTALMYIYMGHLTYDDTKPYEDWFWEKNRIDLMRGYVERIDSDARQLLLADGGKIEYDKLILAVGSVNNLVGWPGQDLPGVQGLISHPDVELLEKNTQGVERGVVVGGGLIGMELAEMLRSRGIEVTFLVREAAYMDYLFPQEESELFHRQMENHGVDLRLGTELAEILAADDGHVGAVRTSRGEEVSCGVVGLTAGVIPNTSLAEASGIEIARGILVDRYFETGAAGVYAVGDCAEHRDPPAHCLPVEQLWYTGREHGETVGLTIAGKPTQYNPGVFFNSAKCFDLEYQTYGHVSAVLPDDQESVLWWNRKDKLIRINYSKDSRAVLGFNLLGIRFRHNVCADWIRGGSRIDDVLENLRAANFDPEFSAAYEHLVAH